MILFVNCVWQPREKCAQPPLQGTTASTAQYDTMAAQCFSPYDDKIISPEVVDDFDYFFSI